MQLLNIDIFWSVYLCFLPVFLPIIIFFNLDMRNQPLSSFIYLFLQTTKNMAIEQKQQQAYMDPHGNHSPHPQDKICFLFFFKKNEDKHFIYRFLSFFNRVCCNFRPIHGNHEMAQMKVSLSFFITFLEIHLSDFCGAA